MQLNLLTTFVKELHFKSWSFKYSNIQKTKRKEV